MAIFNKIRKWQGLGSQGLSIVETALVLPALLALCFGMVETSNLFRTWLTLQKAAQTGARYASTGQGEIEGTRLQDIIAVTEEMLVTLDGETTITIRSWENDLPEGEGTLNDPGDPCQMVQVEIEYDYELIVPLSGLLGPIMPDIIPLFVYDRKINEPWKPCS